ncbi:flavodoxin/nitric oxide synthase [Methanosalsum zhilinae DSM 4017]|uniref:Flavodoxin/nitric oxide synthase n=1 Tax=Methanosalsum zhilinae (strain DSM 4017 / NBRC 107636 / OCM 62 / WeN5) TaxID=679901 RepID=F7XQD3_METZD|nr:FprA family A-type flavoprotein [Methanosalsum zhilinae]AEH61599.1 flavodoxin/nitric oxide synthase [Methanosalsum zhilinae DSM 4017]
MEDEYYPVEISENIYWVGVIDWNLRDFHAYATPKGSSYNSYLILDDKITLIDTVKDHLADEMISRIEKVVDPAKIDYVVANHVEPDHSSSLSRVMKMNQNAKIFATKRAKDGLCQYYRPYGCDSWDFEVVDTGYELDLGKRTLAFIETPMLHWPDSMQTYLKEDRILFSNDGFGQHLASSHRFNDEVDNALEEASEYYANILMPFSKPVFNLLEKVEKLNIEIDMIATGHGIIWRDNPGQIIDAYRKWASGETVPKVLVIYDSMWGSTEKMAKVVVEGITSKGIEAQLLHLRKNEWSMIIREILEAPVIAIGSTTINNGPLHSVAGFLTHLKGLRPKNKKAAVFGSYGWGGGGVKFAESELENTGVEIVEKGIQIKFGPDKEDLKACRELGIRLADIASLDQTRT